jgi:hypothetical protein
MGWQQEQQPDPQMQAAHAADDGMWGRRTRPEGGESSEPWEAKPYDAKHPVMDDGTDWRTGVGERAVSYGNWAGPDNRLEIENKDYIAARQREDPSYKPLHDPVLLNDPRYKAVDGLDQAAKDHDTAYGDVLDEKHGDSLWDFDGLHKVRDADQKLAEDSSKEMAENGDKYSDSAQRFGDGCAGFFGGRAMGVDAADWTGKKENEAADGVSKFADDVSNVGSVDEAATVVGNGASAAASWVGDTASQAMDGLEKGATAFLDRDAVGKASMIAGLANVGGAAALDAAKDVAKEIGPPSLNNPFGAEADQNGGGGGGGGSTMPTGMMDPTQDIPGVTSPVDPSQANGA